MEALVLERKDELSLRDIALDEPLGAARRAHRAAHRRRLRQRRALLHATAAIGPFVVKAPMILGHEAAGEIVEVGSEVRELKVGDRVCMEPGIPDPSSRASRLGKYNLDPDGALLGDAAGARRAAADRGASGRLHLQAAGQRLLCRGRHGRAAGGRHACGDQGRRSRRATSPW